MTRHSSPYVERPKWRQQAALAFAATILFGATLEAAPSPSTQPGAILEVYQIAESLSAIPRLDPDALPNVAKAVTTIDLSGENGGFLPVQSKFFARVRGELYIPRAGQYHFRLISDDGSRLSIDDAKLIEHDGPHAALPKDGTVALKKGGHPFVIEYFDAGGAHSLRLEWKPPGAREFSLAPSELFRHDPDSIGATAPGIKPMTPTVAPTEGLTRQAAIARAIDLATDWLLGEVQSLQVFEEVHVKDKSAQVAFETYALIVGGVSVDDPQVVENFRHLEQRIGKRKYTYGVCSEIMARDAAIAQLEEDRLLSSGGADPAKVIGHPSIGKVHRRRLAELAKIFVDSQNHEGGWLYFPSDTTADISCTQFVVLALAIAERRGAEIPATTWRQVAKYIVSLQKDEGGETDKRVTMIPKEERGGETAKKTARKRGGTRVVDNSDRGIIGGEGFPVRAREFEYTPGWGTPLAGNRWNRVCAGTSSLMVVRELIGARLPADERTAIETGIRDGLGWLLENWSPFDSMYGIYSLEKVGDIGHIQAFDGVDWYDAVAAWLLDAQLPDGSWGKTSMWGELPRVSTAFAILVLRRASAILSQSTVERIVITGDGDDTVTGADLEWVYLPELDTCLHWPELVRIMKRRPRRSSIQVLESVIENVTADRRGALVPALVQIRAGARDKGALKSLNKYLEQILGYEPGEDSTCIAWHRAWVEVGALADAKEAPSAETLLAVYGREPASPTLREAVVRVALRHQVRDLVPTLVEDLEESDAEVRRVAHLGLRGFYSGLPEFDPKGKGSKRKEQVAEVQKFISDHR
mgnify:CR=1 FL=1